VPGCTGSAVIRQAAANLITPVSAGGGRKQHLERSQRDTSNWPSNETPHLDSQFADTQGNPITAIFLFVQNLNNISLESMKNLSVCPLHHCLLFCVTKISTEISNVENKVNYVLSRFFYAIWASAFSKLAIRVSCGLFRTELISKPQD